jgi:hypothetical protein
LLGEVVVRGVVGAECRVENEKLALAEELARSCGWWFPLEGTCFASERTCAVRRDHDRRLHATDRFAVEYPDGWGVCFWRGIHVPSKWIFHSDIVSPIHALTWPDTLQRAALTDILGWDTVLSALKAKLVDADLDEDGGMLFHGRLPDGTRIRFLRIMWGYLLRVPTEMKTAREAKCWTSTARVPGVAVPGRPGAFELLLNQTEAEVKLRGAPREVRLFDHRQQRELTESGWRWTSTQVALIGIGAA